MTAGDDSPWLIAPVVCPALAAIVAFVAARRLPSWVLAGGAGISALPATLLIRDVVQHGPLRQTIGGWAAPLGIGLGVDGLSAAFLGLTAAIALGVSIYAAGYFRDEPDSAAHFWPPWLMLITGLNALFVTTDLFNAYVALELVTLTAVSLIALGGGSRIAPALRYLMFALVGSLFYLAGVALLYGAHGALDFTTAAAASSGALTPPIALALVTTGLLVKAAIFPFHVWLPPAHAAAAAPVSAAMSALVVKGALYLLLRLWLFVFRTPSVGLAEGIAGLGAAAALYGSVQALRQERLKDLVAYSTVAQLGYALLVVALPSRAAWTGTVVHLLAHGLAKAALFMAAGNILHALGSDAIRELRVEGRRIGMSFFAFGVAGLSLAGIPPSGSFLAKWLFVSAALETGRWGYALVVAVGGLLTAAYVARVIRPVLGAAGAPPGSGHTVGRTMAYVPMAMALASIALGFLGAPLGALAGIGAPSLASAVSP